MMGTVRKGGGLVVGGVAAPAPLRGLAASAALALTLTLAACGGSATTTAGPRTIPDDPKGRATPCIALIILDPYGEGMGGAERARDATVQWERLHARMTTRKGSRIRAAASSWVSALVLALCLALVAGVGFSLAWMSAHSAVTSTPIPSPSASSSGVYLGISVHQWSTPDLLSNLRRYQSLVGKKAAMVMYWRDWAESGQIDPTVMKAIYDQGSVPIVSWEPGSYRAGPGPKYSLESIVAGHWDTYIRAFARSLASYHRPVFLRFAHEMNGDWDQWSGQPAEYVAAWRHIHNLFAEEGATYVKWVWCPNVNWDGFHPFEAYYPGDAYVDWLGLDGYNRPRTGWNPFTQIMRISYEAITALSDKPVMIGETGSAEPTPVEAAAGDSKAQWITALYRDAVPSMPRIKAVVWFDIDLSQRDASGTSGYDNRIDTSEGARQAFAQAVAPSFYRSSWP